MSAIAARLHATAVPRPVLEAAAVAATGLGHIGWTLAELPRAPFVFPVVVAWMVYIAWRARRDDAALRDWGLGTHQLREATLATSALFVVAGGAMLGITAVMGHGPPPLTVLVPIVAYPVWGLIQQFMVQALVTGNLVKLPGRLGHPAGVCLVSASLFSLVHWPDTPVMLATFGLGLVFAPLYLRWRNLWPLGFAHGWLGTVLYYGVLGRDPLMTYFG